VNVTADTNVLVRAIVADNPAQAQSAQASLRDAKLVAIPSPVLCELVWVLMRGYNVGRDDVAKVIRQLLASSNVAVNQPAVKAGLAMLEAGGDFADGVIAYQGRWLGGETFVSFDKKATVLVAAQGGVAQLLT